MRRIALLAGAVAILVAGCTSPKFEDLTTVEAPDSSTVQAEVLDPDSVTIYRNVDQFPNISVMCVDGNAIITRSSGWTDWQPLVIERSLFCR